MKEERHRRHRHHDSVSLACFLEVAHKLVTLRWRGVDWNQIVVVQVYSPGADFAQKVDQCRWAYRFPHCIAKRVPSTIAYRPQPKRKFMLRFGIVLPRLCHESAPSEISWTCLRTEDAARRRVNLAISPVMPVQSCDRIVRRFDPRRHPDNRRACLVHRVPHPGADSRKNRGSISRAFFGFYDLYFFPVDVGLNLPPQPRARPAATQPNAIHGYAHLAEDRKAV